LRVTAGAVRRYNYYFGPNGAQIPVAPAPLIAALPQALLAHGTLAVIAHIDLAFPYAFQDVTARRRSRLCAIR